MACIKELLELGIVSAVDWVPTETQLADCLKKKGTKKKADWLLSVARTNTLRIITSLHLICRNIIHTYFVQDTSLKMIVQ